MSKFLIASFLFVPFICFGKTVHYELTVSEPKMNLSGKKDVDFALAVNGSIPAPTLYFVEGDEAEIIVKNEIPNQELSIHWHGLLLPVEMDGVSYVTTPPILEKGLHTFKFPIRQSGTYWYHSHTGLQEQKGVFGAIVIYPKNEPVPKMKEKVIVLSDWSDENPDQIMKNLKKDGDYYRFKKGTLRSIWGASQAGALGTYFNNEIARMGGMDLSDVGYDAFLMNGKTDSQVFESHSDQPEKIKLRIINAAASTYFHLQIGQNPFEVIAADGKDIKILKTKELLMGMAETYDVLVDTPPNENIEIKATAQDGTGYSSGWIGKQDGLKIFAPKKAAIDLYAPMEHTGHAGHNSAEHNVHEHHGGHHLPVLDQVTVDQLQSANPSAFDEKIPTTKLKLVLGGDMERYVWHINGKAMFEDSRIAVRANEVVEIEFENQTMMHHPMHLHGHFFRVLNGNNDFSPWKHTVDVPPHATRTIQFLTNEPGQWLLHCHNLYHMKTGMTRLVDYVGFIPSDEIAHHQKHDPHQHDHWYMSGRFEGRSNYIREFIRYSQTWNEFNLGFISEKSESYSLPWQSKHELYYRRWVGQFTNFFGSLQGDKSNSYGAIGLSYKFPLLIESEWAFTTDSKYIIKLEKQFQWTDYWLSKIEVTAHQDHDPEIEATFDYRPTWHWNFGAKFLKQTVGLGLIYHF